MPLGPGRFIKGKQLGALTTNTTYGILTNDFGETLELEAAQFNQSAAITHSTTGFWTFGITEYSAAGVIGAEVATIHFGTASAAAYGGDHVAFVANDFTLDSTGLSLADGLSWAVVGTSYGTAATLSADAEVIIRFVKGMTAAA